MDSVNSYCREYVHQCCPNVKQTTKFTKSSYSFTETEGVVLGVGYPENWYGGLNFLILVQTPESNDLCLEALKSSRKRRGLN